MGLSQKDQTKHNTLLRLGTQSVKRRVLCTGNRLSETSVASFPKKLGVVSLAADGLVFCNV